MSPVRHAPLRLLLLLLLVLVAIRAVAAVTDVWTVRYVDAPNLGGGAYAVALNSPLPFFNAVPTQSVNGSVTTNTILSSSPLVRNAHRVSE
jgi:hypothetical protein